jgi:hypothetical protein
LEEEHILRALENRVPRKMLRPKRDKVRGEWITLHNEQLYDTYF